MKTYKIELSTEPIREGCLTQFGAVRRYTNLAPYGSRMWNGVFNTEELRHLKCYEQVDNYPIGGYAPGRYTCKCITCHEMFVGDKRAVQCEPCATEITDHIELQRIWEAIRGGEPDQNEEGSSIPLGTWKEWENFTLEPGTYQVDGNYTEMITVVISNEHLKNDNFEDLLQEQLDQLPYEKHADDGGYNDGRMSGFEEGARWANSLRYENK